MFRTLLFSVFLTGLFAFSARPVSAQHAGDRVFDSTRVHTLNVVFGRPWSEVEPILKANKEAEIYIPARLEINCLPPDTSGCVRMDSVGIRFKGNSTYSASRQKNPFRVSFDEYGIDQRWDGLKGFVLNNGWNDASFIRERLHHEIGYNAGVPISRTNYAWVYINGERFSLYHMLELVDKRFLASRFGDDDGHRFKATDIIGNNRRSDFTRRSPFTPAAYHGYYEANSDDTVKAWSRIASFIDTLNLTTEDSIAAVFPRIVNVDDLYRGLGLDAMLGNSDNYNGPAQNFNFYFPSDGGRMRWIPWDVSLTLGSSTNALVRTVSSRPLNNRFTGNAALREDYLRALWFTYHGYIGGTQLHARVDTLKARLQPHFEIDPRKMTTSTGNDASFTTLKSALTTRTSWIEGQFSTNGITAENAIRSGDIVINELAPASGWVELYNRRDYSIDLSGHSLTNDPTQPRKWTFPLRSFVKPKGHIVVRMQGGQLGGSGPANFTLSTSGGVLRLTRASGSIVDSLTYPARSGDSTIARAKDGSGTFGAAFPTPGSSNLGTIVSTGSIAAGAVVINEFMADNGVITSPFGIQADWIELHNKTSSPIALDGAQLSDNPTNPGKWQFPTGTSIAANGYLLVWAYDTTASGVLIADWSLSKDGEHLRLSNADSSIIDSTTFGVQIKNQTTARFPNGTGPFVANQVPTPGSQNTGIVSVADRRPENSKTFELRPGLATVRLERTERVRLTVYNAAGREVAVLLEGMLTPGMHSAKIGTTMLRPGAYLFQLRIGTQVLNRRAVILR